MNNGIALEYRGDGQRQRSPLGEKDVLHDPEPYIASPELREAVSVALYLRRPLLLEGEPGCGKTRLAYAVAYELGLPIKECYIRSTSRARDLLYEYDAVGRLYDLEEIRAGATKSSEPPPRTKYRRLGKLGEAIELAQQDIPSIVLIDEIDKADIDFPNDLLQVLDTFQFTIEETGEKYDALRGKPRETRKDALPLVIITSNREKELPKPFLRRCLFYFIEFPEEATLKQIIDSHFPDKASSTLFEKALRKFLQLREQQDFEKKFPWRKIPSTSEFLDWVQILTRDEQHGKLSADALDTLKVSELPHFESLLKTQSDRNNLGVESRNT